MLKVEKPWLGELRLPLLQRTHKSAHMYFKIIQ